MTRMFRLACGALSASFMYIGIALSQVAPLDQYARDEEFLRMKLSPDGEYLAFISRVGGKESLRFLKLGERNVSASVQAPVGRVFASFHWASDTRVIYAVAHASEADSAHAGVIHAIDRDGKRRIGFSNLEVGRTVSTGTVLPARESSFATAEIVSLLDHDDRHVLISEMPWRASGTSFAFDRHAKPWLTRLDIHTGTQVRIDQVPIPNAIVIVDRADQRRFAVGTNGGESTSVAWKRSPDAEWETYQLSGYRSASVRPRRFTPDAHVLFTAVEDGGSDPALFRLDPLRRTVEKLIDAPGGEIADLVVDPASDEAIGVVSSGDEPTYRWLVPDKENPLLRVQEEIRRVFEGTDVRVISLSGDGTRAVGFVRSPSLPDRYVSFDVATKHGNILAQPPIPLDMFVRSPTVGSMKLSPDGEYIALTTGEGGNQALTIVKLGDRNASASVSLPQELLVYDFHWASNTRVVFTTARRELANIPAFPTAEIYAVDRDGKNTMRIYGDSPEAQPLSLVHRSILPPQRATFSSAQIVSLLAEDDDNILIAEAPWRRWGSAFHFDSGARPRLLRLDIRTGDAAQIDEVPVANANVLADAAGHMRFASSRNEVEQVPVAWRNGDDAWETFEVSGFRAGSFRPRRLMPEDRSVLFTAVVDGESHSALFQLNLRERTTRKLIEIPAADVSDVVVDFAAAETLGAISYTDRLEYRWLQPEHPSAHQMQALIRAFEGNEVRFISRSGDGRRAIVLVKSDVAPGEYLLFDTRAKKAEMLMSEREWIDIKKMRQKEAVSFKARDGTALQGYVTRPIGKGPFPMIVLPHRGPHGVRDTWEFDPVVQMLATRGYAVLQVNYRGSGGFGIDFLESGHRQWGAKMQDDVTDATRWAIEQGIAAPDRICIYGSGYGGYAALMGAAREPSLYRCAIGFVGIYDLELPFNHAMESSVQGSVYLGRVLGDDKADLRARSPVHRAASIKAPVLLIHDDDNGDDDYRQATRMKSALEREGKDVEWLTLRWQLNNVHDHKTRSRVYSTIIEFLDKHLQVPAL